LTVTRARSIRRAVGVAALAAAVVAATAFVGSSRAGVSATARPTASPSASTAPARLTASNAWVRLDPPPLHGWTENEVARAVHTHAAARGAADPARGVPQLRTEDLPTGVRFVDSATADGADVVVPIVEQVTVVGWETAPLVGERILRLRADGRGRPEVIADDPDPDAQDDILDLGVLHGVHRGGVIVLGDASPETLDTMATVGAASVRKVTAFWGQDWSKRVVVVAPASSGEFAALAGLPVDSAATFAAVTTGRAPSTGHGAPPLNAFVGSRVYFNPLAWDNLTDVGKHIVLAHEFTHVAAQSVSRPGLPTWLAEGVADQVGQTGSGIPEEALVAAALTRVRAAGAPVSLPGSDQFSGSDGDAVRAAYAQADVAVQLIARRYGLQRLRAMYRDAGEIARAGDSPADALDYALHRDLHTTVPALTKAWRAELIRLAAR
jgi:hypothetical protein